MRKPVLECAGVGVPFHISYVHEEFLSCDGMLPLISMKFWVKLHLLGLGVTGQTVHGARPTSTAAAAPLVQYPLGPRFFMRIQTEPRGRQRNQQPTYKARIVIEEPLTKECLLPRASGLLGFCGNDPPRKSLHGSAHNALVSAAATARSWQQSFVWPLGRGWYQGLG